MASTRVCFTGFSREELAAVQQLFEQANANGSWQLVPEDEAGVLVIDMDSLYGHMTWLKAQSSGRTTVGVTTGDRSETDYLLRRPLDADALREVLSQAASGAPPPPAPTPPMAATPSPGEDPVAPEAAATASHAADEYIAAFTTGQMAAVPTDLAPHAPALSDYLARGRLPEPSRLAFAGVPALAFDPASQTWTGSAALKPLLPLLSQPLTEADFTPIEPAEFDRLKLAAGGAQPYLRLLWLSGLAAGNGRLLPGFVPNKKFVLTKWPQVEREYPKHFRIATVMMKGPATTHDIAEQAGVPEADVSDFINAGLVTGVIVPEGATSAAGDIERAVQLLARPRPA